MRVRVKAATIFHVEWQKKKTSLMDKIFRDISNQIKESDFSFCFTLTENPMGNFQENSPNGNVAVTATISGRKRGKR